MSEPSDNIGVFQRAVAAQLQGPRRHRAAILAELDDGLLEATEVEPADGT